MQKFFVFLVFTLCLLIPIRPVCGADSTTFNPTTVAVIAKGTSSIPVGTIISWPVAQNPADWQNSDGSYNWLECNGQSISKTVYPELFALMGGQVPDLRGLFLRGHGGNSAELGEPQGDTIRNVTGRVFSLGMANGGTGPFWSYVDGYFGIGSGSYSKHTTMFDLSRVVPTGNENRPVNMAVRYLVRARP
ncbi:phage tail protein [Desulfovibrio piger]|uniref:phage tail protein n=1 Tax=Desulfovibrio piger TaxID=901 RepID=UPI0026EBEA61|nr:phage tail protein [Desulfovibrio piger]